MSALTEPRLPAEAENALPLTRERVGQLERCVTQLTALVAALRVDMAALREENARRITVSHRQAAGLAARIRARADEVCARYQLDPARHAAAVRAACKREVLRSYGIDDLHDLPRADLELAMRQIDGWTSYALVRRRRALERST